MIPSPHPFLFQHPCPQLALLFTLTPSFLYCISHDVFGVDLMTIENHVLVVVLMSSEADDSVLRENRVKWSTRCGCIVGRSSFAFVCLGCAVG